MQKLVMMSVILATFVIPAVLSRKDGASANEYRAVLRLFAPAVVIYILLLLFVYPRVS